jgi:predicted RNA binding protein YcfA (HicA-like mRNA interferase family)
MALRPCSRREFVRKLRALGYSGPFAGGNHQFMSKTGALSVRVPNPHGGSDISISLIKRILQISSINQQDWENA